MKLFGKKTLALFLALAMVMPMCVFAEGEGQQTPPTDPVVDSVAVNPTSATIRVGGTITLAPTVTVTPDSAENRAVNWASSSESVATVDTNGKVTGVAAGTATITATSAKDGTKVASCAVTVVKPTFKENETAGAKTFSVNTPEATVLAKLAKEITVDLVATDDNTSDTVKFTIGTAADSTADLYWTGSYNASVKGDYTFTAVATTAGAAKLANYDQAGKTITCKVTVGDYTTLPKLVIPALLEDSDGVESIDSYVAEYVYDEFGASAVGSTIEFASLDLGTIDNYGDYELDDIDEIESWPAVDSFNAYMTTSTGVAYYVPVELKMYISDFGMKFGIQGGTLADIATYLNTLLDIKTGHSLETIEFYEIDLEGGILYADSDRTEEVEDGLYTDSELAKMVYQPDGSGEYTEIEYVAYYDYEDHSEDEDDYVAGSIYLNADSYMMISIEVTEGDVVEFDSEVFEELFLDQDEDYEELSYVTFSFGSGSNTKGYLYYDYDESGKEGKQGEKVGTSTKCWVDSDKSSDVALDDVVFVPGSKMSAGVDTYTFTAKGYKDGSSSLKTETGYLVITYIETADITVEIGKGEEIAFDLEWFEDVVDEEATSSKKNYEIAYIVFDNAPASKSEGYLYVDGEKIKNPDGEKFYIDDDDDGDYAFDDLTFVGGNAAKTTHATFSVYGRKPGTSSKPTAIITDCTIDFIVGASHSLNGSIKAAQTMSFYQELDAFEALGDNDNVYVEFTSLPKGGKLYYNYGTANQEDVTVGTDYYLTATSGKKQLRYVTFVPSYSSSKIAQTVTFNVKGYNKNDKAVSGTVNVAVSYASYSAYFTDVKTSTYADSVDFLYNKGITTGMTTTTFGPDTNVTRGQFVTFLYRAAGQPTVTAANNFTDVKSSDYYYNAVRWAVKEGITNGRSATIFDPNANVTYQEIMTFLYRYDVTYLGHTAGTGSASYVYDFAKVDTWAQTAVKWAVYKGIFTSGNLYPTTAGTRANVALYMHRMLTL